ncbi:hypothetical protein GCM10020000_70800 [Streptomyces olivoverticillatus]
MRVGAGGAGQPEVFVGGHALLGERGERRRGADLHEGVLAAPFDGADAVGEVHRLADVPDPVLGRRQLARCGDFAGGVGDQSHGGLVEADTGQGRAELVVRTRHQRRVEGVRDGQALDADAAVAQHRDDLFERGLAAGYDALLRGVDGGDRQVGVVGAERGDVLGRGGDRRHSAGYGHLLHQARPDGDEGDRVVEGEHAGDRRGRDLTDAVAEQDVGADAPRDPQFGERVLVGEERGLGVQGLVDRRRVIPGRIEQQGPDRPSEAGCEQPIALVDVRAEFRVAQVQLPAHARVLGALPGEEERDLADVAGGGALRFLLCQVTVEQPHQVLARADHARHAPGEVGAADVAGVAQVRDVGVGVLVEEAAVALQLEPQGPLGLGGEREDAAAVVGGRCPGRGGCLFQDGGRDAAREAEAVDERAPGPGGLPGAAIAGGRSPGSCPRGCARTGW